MRDAEALHPGSLSVERRRRRLGGNRTYALTSAFFIFLSSCSELPGQARRDLVGVSLPDLVSCAGQPAERMRVGRDDWVLTFAPVTITTPSVTGSVPLLGDLLKPSVTASAQESCRMTARVRGGRIASLHYVGTSSLLFGAHAACAPLVRDCLKYPDRTSLPENYSADDILSQKENGL